MKLDKQYQAVMNQYSDLEALVNSINELRDKIHSLSDYYSKHDFTDDQFIDFIKLVDIHNKLYKKYQNDCDNLRIDTGLALLAIKRFKEASNA